MSATPRTDAYIGDGNDDNMTEGEIAMCDFARTLETELAAVTKQRDELAALFEYHMDYNNIIECARADIREQIQTILNQ